jgi:hypothetical protein
MPYSSHNQSGCPTARTAMAVGILIGFPPFITGRVPMLTGIGTPYPLVARA